MTGSNDYDNLMNSDAPVSFGYFGKYVNQPPVREMIHVGNATFNNGHDCEMSLLAGEKRSSTFTAFLCECTAFLHA
jgi:hypothetical protein